MKIFLTLVKILLITTNLFAQTIQPLEPVSRHYESLQKLSDAPDPNQSELNARSYPSSERETGKQFIGLEPSYLNNSHVEQLKSVISFPANSSEQVRAELDYLLDWQAKRGAKERRRAYAIASIGYWPPLEKDGPLGDTNDLFWEWEEIMESKIDADDYPATTRLLAGVTRDMRIMEFTLKYHFLRPRPYHLEPKLEPMGRVPNPSFASGHTLWAYIQAFAWSELIPNRRSDFLEIAYEVGESREIMGIHYPSDEEAARVVAHRMLVMMLDNEEFKQDLKNAKAEWK